MTQAFTQWIETLFATEENELDCRQFQNYLPAFVEAELNNTPLPQTAVLMTHLQQCPDCNEIYQGLKLVMVAESDEPFTSNTTEYSSVPTGD